MLEDLAPRNTKKVFKIEAIRNSLEPADQKLFDEYLEDVNRWSPSQLALALHTQGITISADTIRRHRQRLGLC
jgi:hypothetical protein